MQLVAEAVQFLLSSGCDTGTAQLLICSVSAQILLHQFEKGSISFLC